MAYIEWTEELSVGIKIFDDDHKELVALVNRLHDSISIGTQQSALIFLLKELENYTIFHFGHEEGMMLQYAYPDYEKHKTEHDELVARVREFSGQVASGQTKISLSLMGFLKEWLVKHIMGTDKKYIDYFSSKGIS